MRQMLGRRKRLKALLHVTLQARLEASQSGRAVRDDLKTAGFNADLILANVRKLRGLVESLAWEPGAEGWVEYGDCTHVGRDRDTKSAFLEEILERRRPRRVVDLGANDGHFTAIAAKAGATAVAVDGDEGVLDAVYRRQVGVEVVLSDLGNPSPSQGWAGQERPALFNRISADMVVAYGVIHHLIYTASVPPIAVLEWLRGLDAPVALEYVSPDDEMVGRLLANKRVSELHPGRGEDEFRRLIEERFAIEGERRLGSGTRVLFDLSPRQGASRVSSPMA
jgi:hypothetical protein